MADHHHPHHHHHRPTRISLPPRAATLSSSSSTAASSTPRPYPLYHFPSTTTPTATPSKHRHSSLNSFRSRSSSSKSSLSFLLLLLLSLRSLYSLLPFLRSSTPSFSLFPLTFLVSLLSFFLSLAFSLRPKQNLPSLALSALSHSQLRLLFFKSLILAAVFLIRFQALRYCGTAAMILAELSGGVAARFFLEGQKPSGNLNSSKVRGFFVLFVGIFLLSFSWDRTGCFPFTTSSMEKFGFSLYPREGCVRIWPMLLPFLSGFLGCYERVSMNGVSIRQLGRKRVRLISLLFATVLLFVPAVVSFLIVEGEGDGVTFGNLGWPLANTVVFGVLLTENYTDDKLASSKDFRREFLVTFSCTIVLELFYFPELSLGGLLLCGSLLYFAVRELDPVYTEFLELGVDTSESLGTLVMKPIRHILSERKSRKIALFLLINSGYMVLEFVAGFMSNSLGLISDACHMLFDCAALAIGLYASYISRLPANNQFNYGRGRFEVLSGYANAVFLVLVGTLIVLESFERILDPQEISTDSLLSVSIGGLVVNIVGLIFFHEEHDHAHGGCSHSHAHSHSHSHSHSRTHLHHNHQHPHDCVGHDHGSHGKHNELITISNECHEMSCSGHGDHQGRQHSSVDSHRENDRKEYEHHDHNNSVHNHGHTHNHTHHGSHAKHNELITVSNECHEISCSGHEDNQGHQHSSVESHTENDGKENECHDHNKSVHNHAHAHQGHTHNHSHHSGAHHHEPRDHGCQQSKVSSNVQEAGKQQHRHIDHNMEGIFLHVLADTMGSVGVVISTLLIKYKGWLVADPACSIFISILIVSSVIPLLRNSAEILLQRIPRVHEQSIKRAISEVIETKGVRGIRNLHIWSFTNTDVVGTIHLHITPETDKASMKAEISHILHDAGIKDLTLQLECTSQ